MGKKIDLTGCRFGMLTVIKENGRCSSGGVLWKCECDCGETTTARSRNLINGKTKSCGCILKGSYNRTGHGNESHGLSKHKLFKKWSGMKTRCYNKKDKFYNIYGGRGINVCDEWIDNFKSFYDWSMENGYVDGLSIDRIDNNGDYTPSNCRWTTMKTQSRNRRNSLKVLYKGEEKPLMEACVSAGLDYRVVYSRIYIYNWCVDRALSTPLTYSKRRNIKGGHARK